MSKDSKDKEIPKALECSICLREIIVGVHYCKYYVDGDGKTHYYHADPILGMDCAYTIRVALIYLKL